MPRRPPSSAPGPAPGWDWKRAVTAIGGGNADGVGRMVERAARATGLTCGTCLALYHGKIANPGWDVGLAVQAALAAGGHITKDMADESRRMAEQVQALERRLAVLEQLSTQALAVAVAQMAPRPAEARDGTGRLAPAAL
jgi:hypothetical protein